MKGKRFLLALCVLLIAGAMTCLEAANVLYMGNYGKNKSGTWKVYDDGLLEMILPSDGQIPNYEGEENMWGISPSLETPWGTYRDIVDHLEVKKHPDAARWNLTRIGKYAFQNMHFTKGVRFDDMNNYLYLDGTLGHAALHFTDMPYLHLVVAPSITDFEISRYALDGDIPVVSLTNVRVINEHALADCFHTAYAGIHRMVDLGSEIRMLKAGSLGNSGLWHTDGAPSVFIQNPTPPKWKRLHEDWDWTYEYPFGNRRGGYDSEVIVVVPLEYLNTYKTYYHKDHPETPDGYMCARYIGGSNCKSCETAPAGRIVPGEPIYDSYDRHMEGWWYIDEDARQLHVGSLNGKCPDGSKWRYTLAQYISDYPAKAPKTIVLHDIEYIPGGAFSSASLQGIDTVIMPKCLKEIGHSAFKNITSIKIVKYNPKDYGAKNPVKLIGRHAIVVDESEAFKGCTALEKIEELEFDTIGHSAFEGCTALTTVNYNTAKLYRFAIGIEAFKDCPQFKYMDFERVERIRNNAFENNLAIKEIELARNCELDNYIFKNSHLQKVRFGDGIITEKLTTFCNCPFLTDIYMGHYMYKNRKQVSGSVFDENRLSSINLHVDYDWATPYEEDAIFSQMNIIKENMPLQVSGKLNGGYVSWMLDSRTKVLTITPLEYNGSYESSKTGFFIPSFDTPQDQPWYAYRSQIKGIMLMSARDAAGREYGITEIGKNAFAFPNTGESRITDVSIPRACTKIGEAAFKNNDNLVTVHIEDVTRIGSYAFENCTRLVRLDLGKNLTQAGDYIFRNCPKLNALETDAVTPAAVTQYTFADIGNGQTVNGPRRNIAREQATDGQQNVTLTVPMGALNNYLMDANWGKFQFKAYDPTHGNIVTSGQYGDGYYILYADGLLMITAEHNPATAFTFPENVRANTARVQMLGSMGNVPDNLFYAFENLSGIELSESIHKIGNNSFSGCQNLYSFDFSNIDTIGNNAFTVAYFKSGNHYRSLDAGLAHISLPKAKYIGQLAFQGCKAKSISISGSPVIKEGAFASMDSLQAINLGSCELQSYYCFAYCDKLEEVIYNGAVIPSSTFTQCASLRKVVFGQNLTSIGELAFLGCDALDTIFVDAPVPPEMKAVNRYDCDVENGCTCWDVFETPFSQKHVCQQDGSVLKDEATDHTQINVIVPAIFEPKYRAADIWKDMIIGHSPDDELEFPVSFRLGGNAVGTIDAQGNLTIDGRGEVRATTREIRNTMEAWGPYITNSITFGYNTKAVYASKDEYDMFAWLTNANLQKWGTQVPATVTFGALTKAIGTGLFDVDVFTPSNVTFNCYAVTPPEIRHDAFSPQYLVNGTSKPTLHVVNNTTVIAAYRASAWNDLFNIVGDLAPQEAPYSYTVTFIDGYNGDTLSVQTVGVGQDAVPPTPDKTHVGYPFKYWTGNYKEVTRNETVTAYHEYTTYTVTFKNGSDIYDLQTVEYYADAVRPAVDPTQEGKIFKGWSEDSFEHITGSKTVKAVYASVLPATSIALDPDIKTIITTTAELQAGITFRLTPNILPFGASAQQLVWTSEYEDVATVDQNGLVTVTMPSDVYNDMTVIRATTTDGTGLFAECLVDITNDDNEFVPVYATSVRVLGSKEITLSRGMNYENGEERFVRVAVEPGGYNYNIDFGQMSEYGTFDPVDPEQLSVEQAYDDNWNLIKGLIKVQAPMYDPDMHSDWQPYDVEVLIRVRSGEDTSVDWLYDTITVHVAEPIIFTENNAQNVPVTYHVTDLAAMTCETFSEYDEMTGWTPFMPYETAGDNGYLLIPGKVRGYYVTCVNGSCASENITTLEFGSGIQSMTAAMAIPMVENVILPKSFKRLDSNSGFSYNDQLRNVYIYATTPPVEPYPEEWGDGYTDYFANIGEGHATLHVVNGCYDAYNKAPWTMWFETIVEDLENISYNVRFEDYDGWEIETKAVESGEAAEAPAVPEHEGFTFVGWDKSFDCVTENMVVKAVFQQAAYVCDFTTMASNHSNYNDAWTYDSDWTVFGGANNGGQWEYAKMGGKNTTIASVNPVYVMNKNRMGRDIVAIRVSYHAGSFPKNNQMDCNAWGVKVYSDLACTNLLYTVTATEAISGAEQVVTLTPADGQPWSAGYGIQLFWDLSNSSSTNGIIWVDKIEYITAASADAPLWPEYSISFLNWNGAVLQSEAVRENAMPVFNGGIPQRAADDEFTYAFSGWSPAVVAATEEASYTAQFTATRRQYTITFLDWDGTELQSGLVEYGEMPVFAGNEPQRDADSEYTYTFMGWSPSLISVYGEAVYMAQYLAVPVGGGDEALDNIHSDAVPCTKILHNGQLYIIRGSMIFNASGLRVK